MGILDRVLGTGGKKDAAPVPSPAAASKGSPFAIATSFRPLRLNARNDASVDFVVDLSNISGLPQMCSLVVELPASLGFDGVGLHKTKELRLGMLDAEAKKQVVVGIAGSNQTPAGLYRLKVTAYSHYRDYAHVLNSVSKTVELRVV